MKYRAFIVSLILGAFLCVSGYAQHPYSFDYEYPLTRYNTGIVPKNTWFTLPLFATGDIPAGSEGGLIMDSTLHYLYVHNGTAWQKVALPADLALYLPLAGGTMTGALQMDATPYVRLDPWVADGAGNVAFNLIAENDLGRDADVLRVSDNTSAELFSVAGDGESFFTGNINVTGTVDGVDVSGIPATYVAVAGDTMTGALVMNTGGRGQDLTISEGALSRADAGDISFGIDNTGAGDIELRVNGDTVWNAGNDGTGSTLDADLLDGVAWPTTYTKGTVLVGNAAGTAYTTLAVGANDTVLTADSGETDGVKWAAAGGGSPGGADTNIQYNNSGAFGGEAAFTYDDSTDILEAGRVVESGKYNPTDLPPDGWPGAATDAESCEFTTDPTAGSWAWAQTTPSTASAASHPGYYYIENGGSAFESFLYRSSSISTGDFEMILHMDGGSNAGASVDYYGLYFADSSGAGYGCGVMVTSTGGQYRYVAAGAVQRDLSSPYSNTFPTTATNRDVFEYVNAVRLKRWGASLNVSWSSNGGLTWSHSVNVANSTDIAEIGIYWDINNAGGASYPAMWAIDLLRLK